MRIVGVAFHIDPALAVEDVACEFTPIYWSPTLGRFRALPRAYMIAPKFAAKLRAHTKEIPQEVPHSLAPSRYWF